MKHEDIHLLLTDSGMGGLSVCAEIERIFRHTGPARKVRLTYFNAWPDEAGGYNALPDPASRARVFDLALARMELYRPDLILIACNTLSVLYSLTEFSREARTPVMGIVQAGIERFVEALLGGLPGSIVLLGTRTTIESGVHRDLLVARGIANGRIIPQACHGLAAAIEKNLEGPAVAELVDALAARACASDLRGPRLYAGLCCTHYSYASEEIRAALERKSGKEVCMLDPVRKLAESAVSRFGAGAPKEGESRISLEVVSKVRWEDSQQRPIAKRLASISPLTAQSLLSYTHVPDLF
jgi:glutamate racemase